MNIRQSTWRAVTALLVSASLGACTTGGVPDDELTPSAEAQASQMVQVTGPPRICSNTVVALLNPLERSARHASWLVVRFERLTQRILDGDDGPFSWDLTEGPADVNAYLHVEAEDPYCTDAPGDPTVGDRWPAVAGTVTVEVLEVMQETACFNPSIEAMITLEGMRFRDDDGRILATEDVRTDRGNFATDGQDCEEEPEN